MEYPELTQEPLLNVDSTPDEGYPLRILKAHRENCNVRWSDTKGEPLSLIFGQVNKACEERAEILDRAIEVLRKEGNR